MRARGAPGITVRHEFLLDAVTAAGDDPVRRVLRGAADPRAYFVHSWAAPVGPDTVALTRHGREFAAVVQRGTVTGMQFHPERSGGLGSRLLAAFCGVTPGGTA